MRITLASLFATLALSSIAHAGPKVLLCVDDAMDGGAQDIQTKLKAANVFDAVDYIDCSMNTPTLNQLKAYAGVLVFDNFGYQDPNTLGTNLADYVDAGGGVVSMHFDFDSGFQENILGRWNTDNYDCVQPNNTGFNASTLKAQPNDPNSPLVMGVTSITSDLRGDGGINKQRGAVSVWDWQDGVSAVCLMMVNGVPRVDINFYPGLGAYKEGKAGDGATLIKNALLVVTGGLNPLKGMPNPAMFPDTGTGAISAPVTVTYTNTDKNAQTVTGLIVDGTNAGDFVIVKAPQLPMTVASMGTFTVQLAFQPTAAGARTANLRASVQGQMSTGDVKLVGNALLSQLVVTPTPAVIGGSLVGQSITKDLTVTNKGNAIVKVLSAAITVDAAEFSIANAPAFPVGLGPGGSFTITIQMTPQANGKLAGTLTVTSTDMTTPTINTPLTGCAGPSMIVVDSASVAFGGVNLGATSAHMGTITNAGCQDLKVSSLALGGNNPGDFILDAKNFPAAIPADQSLGFTVTFKPTVLGNRSATLTIASDDPMTPNKVIDLLGSGTMSSVAVNPGMIDFGMVKAGMPSAEQTFAVTNGGNGTLHVMAIAFSDPQYSQSSGPMPVFTVGGMASQTIGVKCTPMGLGPINATATVMTDVGNAKVNLTCTGQAPKIVVMPSPIDFGMQNVNMQSAGLAVTIQNAGTDDLNIATINIDGMDLGDFTSNDFPNLPLTLPANQMTTFHISFTPSRSGPEVASLDLMCDDPQLMAPMIPIHGTGIQKGIKVSPMTIDFGGVMVGGNKMVGVTISNTGDGDLAIKTIAPTGMAPQLFTVDMQGPLTIPNGMTAMVNVTFSPLAVGVVTNTSLTITPMDVAPVSIPMKGTGTSLGLAVTPMMIDFGQVAQGMTSAPITVGIKNTNPQAIQIASIATADSTFAIDMTKTTKMLMPNATTTFDVTFTPAAQGMKSTTIGITLMGQNKPIATVMATGTGVMQAMMPGGCACNLGSRAQSPSLALLALLALACLVRRRR